MPFTAGGSTAITIFRTRKVTHRVYWQWRVPNPYVPEEEHMAYTNENKVLILCKKQAPFFFPKQWWIYQRNRSEWNLYATPLKSHYLCRTVTWSTFSCNLKLTQEKLCKHQSGQEDQQHWSQRSLPTERLYSALVHQLSVWLYECKFHQNEEFQDM